MEAWRLVKTRYARAAFDGEGARRYGGRWNSPGVRIAYASESIALAVLEVLVHLQSPAPLSSYSLATARFPESLVERLDAKVLPPGWRQFPPPPAARALGNRWARECRSAVLRVPSAVIPAGVNFLLNPAHPDFPRIVVDPPAPFEFDIRVLGK